MKKEQLNGSNTNACKRVDEFLEKLFGKEINKNVLEVKYQLLTALIGTLEETVKTNSKKAFFIVQVIETDLADKEKVKKNHDDLNQLIRLLDNKNIKKNQILGSYKFVNYPDIELYIGYLKT